MESELFNIEQLSTSLETQLTPVEISWEDSECIYEPQTLIKPQTDIYLEPKPKRIELYRYKS